MLFSKDQKKKGIESFNPSKCVVEREKKMDIIDDEVAMGCSEGCWSGCIGSCRRFQN